VSFTIGIYSKERGKPIAELTKKYVRYLFGKDLFDFEVLGVDYPKEIYLRDIQDLWRYARFDFNAFFPEKAVAEVVYYAYNFLPTTVKVNFRGGRYYARIAVVVSKDNEEATRILLHELIAEMGWKFNRSLNIGHDRIGQYDCILGHRGKLPLKFCEKCSKLLDYREEFLEFLKNEAKNIKMQYVGRYGSL